MEQHYPFSAEHLAYDLSGFMPKFDPNTVYFHYENVYKSSVDQLNYLISYYPQIQDRGIDSLITGDIPNIPPAVKNEIKTHAGSVYSHNVFFDRITSNPRKIEEGKLKKAISDRYGSIDKFESLFFSAVSKLLVPGFVWLNTDKDANIHISITTGYSTPNLEIFSPLICFDTWEHSYFLRYPCNIFGYYKGWFEFIDWEKADMLFSEGVKE